MAALFFMVHAIQKSAIVDTQTYADFKGVQMDFLRERIDNRSNELSSFKEWINFP